MLPSSAAWVIVVTTIVSRSMLSTMVALLLWGVAPNLLGFQTSTVMSGSMTPRLQVGDAVVVRPLDAAHLVPGQVLLFDDPDDHGRLRMHRLVAMREDGLLVTKGDANPTQDSSPVSIDALHGAGFLRVPFAGLPSYWYRTGQTLPLAATGLLVVLLVAGVRMGRLLEEPEDRERRRHRGARIPAVHRVAAAGAAVLLLSAGALTTPTSAQARYSATIRPPASSWTSACGDITPSATGTAPRFYWSYGTGTTTSVPDQSGNNDPGTLAGSWSRTTGCSGGSSPFVTVGAAGTPVSLGGIVETKPSLLPGDMTVATWFKTTSKGGVIADFGSSNISATSGNIDRALYIRADGNLTFAAKTLSIVNLISTPGAMYCTTTNPAPNGYADGQWHLVVATFGYSAGCTLTVDNGAGAGSSVAVAPTLTLVLLNQYTGYWRFGYDGVTSSNWTGATLQQAYVGSLDETQAYDAILDAAARSKIFVRSH